MKTSTGKAAKKDEIKLRIREFAETYFEYPHLKNLAETCGVDYNHLLKMGVLASPTMRVLNLFLKNADMSQDWLMTGEGPMRYSERLALAEQAEAAQEALEEMHALQEKIAKVQALLNRGEPADKSP